MIGEIESWQDYFSGKKLMYALERVKQMMHETSKLHEQAADAGLVPRYREEVKVMTVGTFDIFHRGHANLLRGLRSFGGFVVVGVHDDDSYFRLKKKHPIDSLKQRMDKVKPFADLVFAIPDTDPTPVSEVS